MRFKGLTEAQTIIILEEQVRQEGRITQNPKARKA